MKPDHEIQQIRFTQQHVRVVAELLNQCIVELLTRASSHDASKFGPEEWPAFLENTGKLKDLVYGSDEYKASLAAMKPALDLHYAANRHHPEHFSYDECNGCFTRYESFPPSCPGCGYTQFTRRSDITQMTLIDLLEMLCDWIASTQRQRDGDIHKSIELNQERFGYSDELKHILKNTVVFLEKTRG